MTSPRRVPASSASSAPQSGGQRDDVAHPDRRRNRLPAGPEEQNHRGEGHGHRVARSPPDEEEDERSHHELERDRRQPVGDVRLDSEHLEQDLVDEDRDRHQVAVLLAQEHAGVAAPALEHEVPLVHVERQPVALDEDEGRCGDQDERERRRACPGSHARHRRWTHRGSCARHRRAHSTGRPEDRLARSAPCGVGADRRGCAAFRSVAWLNRPA
jgi:hypothetical protein